jgi:hypothetical protein
VEAAQRSDCRRAGASIWARQLISAIALELLTQRGF